MFDYYYFARILSSAKCTVAFYTENLAILCENKILRSDYSLDLVQDIAMNREK